MKRVAGPGMPLAQEGASNIISFILKGIGLFYLAAVLALGLLR